MTHVKRELQALGTGPKRTRCLPSIEKVEAWSWLTTPIRPPRTNRVLAILLGFAVVAIGVLAYLYIQEKREIVRIDVPGFSGSISKEPGGFSGKIGKDKEIDVQVD